MAITLSLGYVIHEETFGIQVACCGNPNQCIINGQSQLECGDPVQSTPAIQGQNE